MCTTTYPYWHIYFLSFVQAYEEAKANMSSDVASYEELSKMEYLDWVVHEAMRMYPAAPRFVFSCLGNRVCSLSPTNLN